MKVECRWNEKMKLTATSGEHRVKMDSRLPLGDDTALTPKQLVLAGLCGCTAMDVVALLKKYKQPLVSFVIDAEAKETESGHPRVFTEAHLAFKFTGEMEAGKVLEAVALSQTRFCGVSAMLSKALPIRYTVELNSETIGSGQANFS